MNCRQQQTTSRRNGFTQRRAMSALAALIALATLAVAPAFAANNTLEVESLSNRPDKVSGGDVLAKVQVPPDTSLGAVRVKLNGADVTQAFWQDTANHALMGLVTGMQLGKNKVEATAKGLGPASSRSRTIRPRARCSPAGRTAVLLPNDQFSLGYPMAPNVTATQIANPCHVDTRVHYVYRSTAAKFTACRRGPLPGDLVITTTNEGQVVPYISASRPAQINRAIYQTAVLADPAILGPDLQHRGSRLERAARVTFGGGCPGGWYRQGDSTRRRPRQYDALAGLRGRVGVTQRVRQQLQRPSRH